MHHACIIRGVSASSISSFHHCYMLQAYIINHAQDSVILADASFVPVLTSLLPRCPTVKHVVLLTGGWVRRAARGARTRAGQASWGRLHGAAVRGMLRCWLARGREAGWARGSAGAGGLLMLRLPTPRFPPAADERHMPKQTKIDVMCYEDLLMEEVGMALCCAVPVQTCSPFPPPLPSPTRKHPSVCPPVLLTTPPVCWWRWRWWRAAGGSLHLQPTSQNHVSSGPPPPPPHVQSPNLEGFKWEVQDENQGAGLCYTSGTTGMPKVCCRDRCGRSCRRCPDHHLLLALPRQRRLISRQNELHPAASPCLPASINPVHLQTCTHLTLPAPASCARH